VDTAVLSGRSSAGSDPRPAVLSGRERELAELHVALADARRGCGSFVLVSGEGGIGKTALVGRLAEEAADKGVDAVWGRCWEGGGAPAFWPWGQIVDELCRGHDQRWLEQTLGAGLQRLAAIAPEVSRHVASPPRPPPGDAQQARFALIDSLARLIRAASRDTPLLLALEDIHAADADALLALEFIGGELGDAAVLCVATFRPEELSERPVVDMVIAALSQRARSVRLAGLSDAGLTALIAARTGEAPAPKVLRAVSVLTGGNPFFAVQVARGLAEAPAAADGRHPDAVGLALPDSARDAIERRLRALPPAARAILEAAAVVGLECRVAMLERTTGVARSELIELLDVAAASGVVLPLSATGMVCTFRHGLVRETLYRGLGTVERGRLHAAAGEAMETIYAGDLELRYAEVAHHFYEAAVTEDPAKAVAYATLAGRRALRLLAWAEAARLFQQALDALELGDPDPPRRAELLVELGRAQVHAGAPGARETLRAAAAAASAVERPDLLAEAALDFGAFALSPGIVDDEEVRGLEQALLALDPSDTALRVRLLARLGVALYWSANEERRLAVSAEAVAVARRLDDKRTLIYALVSRQGASSSPDRTEECVAIGEELFALAASLGERELVLPARIRHVGYLLELDDLVGSDLALATLEQIASDCHDPRAEAYVPLERSRRMALEGRFEAADQLTADAARVGARLQDSTIPLQAAAQITGMRWIQGRMSEMETELKHFADSRPAMPVYRAALALAACEAGHEPAARRELARLGADDFAKLPRDSVWLVSMALLAEVCWQLRDAAHAGTVYDLLLPFATRSVVSPDAVFAGPVARYLGLLAAACEEWELAERHFDAATAQAQADGARPMLLRVRLDRAEMLLARGGTLDGERAAELLAQAEALGEELDLPALLARIAAARAGVASPRPPADRGAVREPVVAVMCRDGETWRFEFAGRSFHVRDLKGMRHLAVLLASPGTPIPAREVEARATGTAAVRAQVAPATAADAGLDVREESALPGLDRAAKVQYMQRREELTRQIARAARTNPGEAERARQELGWIERQLAADIGRGGRDRPVGSGAERTRLRVTRALQTAIRRIAEQDADLGEELQERVRTGNVCAYKSHPRRPVEWRVDVG